MATSNGSVLVVIPARLASQRLPEKPLKDIVGKTLVQRVWDQVRSCALVERVVVATDSDEIASVVRNFGGEVVMTSSEITTGSERVAVAAKLISGHWRTIVNVQGDMPFIDPKIIDDAIRLLDERRDDFGMVTIATPIYDEKSFLSPMVVKVVVDANLRALYFSRAPIPHSRDGDRLTSDKANTLFGYKHMGLYVFTPETAERYIGSTISQLEGVEKLEQIRLLEMGVQIGVAIVDPRLTERSIEVDTPEDLERSRELARSN